MIDEDDVEAIAKVLACVFAVAMGYLVTAGAFWLVCLCFGWEWSWLGSLGVWLALVFLKAVLGRSGR